jgi:radical SAM superfamily enzyme YgiQ (UPF0313 family)
MDRYAECFIDLTADEFARKVVDQRPKFVGISSLTTQARDAEEIALRIKELDATIKVVHGGVHFSSLPQDGLGTADLVVIGEGEEAMRKIVSQEVTTAKGIIHGSILQPLDDSPVPGPEQLAQTGFEPELVDDYGIITARGCPFQCYFCKDGVRTSIVRHHSVDYVCRYIQLMFQTYGERPVFVLDDIFIPGPERLREYIDALKLRSMKVTFRCFFHPNAVLRKLLPLYRELGIETVALGIESGSPEILEDMGKKCSKERIEQAVADLNEFRFKVIGLFILGHKGETPKTLRETLDFAESLKMHFCHFSYLSPFPGTPIWKDGVEKYGEIIEPDMSKWGNAIPVFLPKGLTLSQLEEGMARAREIMDRLLRKMRTRRVRNALLKGNMNFLWTAAKRRFTLNRLHGKQNTKGSSARKG